MAKMPMQRPGKSKQDWGTPPEFLAAVKNRLQILDFSIDLAASTDNAVAGTFYDEEADALADNRSWNSDGWAWLNPPYGYIAPWVEKATKEAQRGAHIAVLVPASVGANWWGQWVMPYAFTSYLNGRLKFVGAKDYYPKDTALLLYTPWGFIGHEVWSWRASVPQLQQSESSED